MGHHTLWQHTKGCSFWTFQTGVFLVTGWVTRALQLQGWVTRILRLVVPSGSRSPPDNGTSGWSPLTGRPSGQNPHLTNAMQESSHTASCNNGEEFIHPSDNLLITTRYPMAVWHLLRIFFWFSSGRLRLIRKRATRDRFPAKARLFQNDRKNLTARKICHIKRKVEPPVSMLLLPGKKHC